MNAQQGSAQGAADGAGQQASGSNQPGADKEVTDVDFEEVK